MMTVSMDMVAFWGPVRAMSSYLLRVCSSGESIIDDLSFGRLSYGTLLAVCGYKHKVGLQLEEASWWSKHMVAGATHGVSTLPLLSTFRTCRNSFFYMVYLLAEPLPVLLWRMFRVGSTTNTSSCTLQPCLSKRTLSSMRLINVKNMKLSEFLGEDIPPYAILSH